jgi:hypothetical protein
VEKQCNNQLDKRRKRGVTRGDGAMRSGDAGQMGCVTFLAVRRISPELHILCLKKAR